MSDGYWYPFRNSRWIRDLMAKADAEERDRREWIEDVKHRLGIRCFGDEERPAMPEWPVVDLEPGSTYRVVGEQAMASYDGVHFYVKPDGMSFAEWWASLPSAPSASGPPTSP